MGEAGHEVDDRGFPPDTEIFGSYRLVEILGRGGMGEVWRAFDTRRERTIALKRLGARWADLPEFRRRFQMEARVTARLQSEHVVVIHDFGEIDGQLFIDMRLVAGGDLAAALATRSEGFDQAEAVNLCSQIADALDAAHAENLIHRDVKPSNVLLAPDRTGPRAYLVDFGIAKLADEATAAGLTTAGTTLGTPAYMAPELFDGSEVATVASDVYALGCVLYEMLTGRRVASASTPTGLMAQHLGGRVPPPSTIRPGLAPFDAVLSRALARDPGDRQASAGMLAAEAEAARATTGRPARTAIRSALPRRAPSPADVGVRPAPRTRRRRLIWIASAAAIVLLAASTVVATVVLDRPAASPADLSGPLASRLPENLNVSLPSPAGVAVDPAGRRAYVVDNHADVVTVVDLATDTPAATIPVGRNPIRDAVSPDGTRLYVTDTGTDESPGGTMTVIDTQLDRVVATVAVGVEPIGVVVSPDGRRVYVANFGAPKTPGSTVSAVDTATDSVVATFTVGAGSDRLSISADGRTLYVPAFGSVSDPGSTVDVVDTGTGALSTVLPAGDLGPIMTIPAPDGRHVYVVCVGRKSGTSSIQVLDLATKTARPLFVDPIAYTYEAALSPDGRSIVIPDSATNKTSTAASKPVTTVVVVDTATGAHRTVAIGGQPNCITIAPDGRSALVTALSPGGLWRVPLDPS